MKKIITLLTFTLFVLSLIILPKTANASGNISILLNRSNVVIGENFNAEIKAISPDANFYSINFELSYDRTKINFVDAEMAAGLLTGCTSGSIDWSDGYGDDSNLFIQLFRTDCEPLAITDLTTLVKINFIATSSGVVNFTYSNIEFYSSSSTLETGINSVGNSITVLSSDTQNPIVNIISPADNPYTTDTAPITISGTASDDVEIDYIKWESDKGWVGRADGTTIWSFDADLVDGDNLITVTAHDHAGKISTDTITIKYSPVYSQAVVSLNPATQNINFGSTVSVTLRVSNVIDLDNMMTEINFDNTKLTYDHAVISSDISNLNWTVNVSDCMMPSSNCINVLAMSDFVNLVNGNTNIITLYFNTISSGSNQFTYANNFLYDLFFTELPSYWNTATVNIIDNVSPSIVITSPTSNPTYATVASSLIISGTAIDNVGVTQVTWVSNRGRSGSASGTNNWTSNVILSNGQNIITYTVRDAAGNTNTDVITVTYNAPDTQNPIITILLPTANATYATSTSPISLSGTASDNVSVTQVTWSSNRGSLGTANGTSTWSINGSYIALLSGQNIITVTASDAVGNTGTDTITVTLTSADIVVPVRSSGLPSGSLAANTTQTTLSLTTDELAICRYSTTAGVAFSSMTNIITSASSTNHAVSINGLTNGGNYNYYVKCQDIFSNANLDDYTISFSVSNPSSGGGGGGGGSSTPTPVTPPVVNEYNFQPTFFTITRTDTNVILNWTNPVDINFNKIIIIRTTDAISDYMTYGAISGIGLKLYEGTAQTFTDNSIAPNIIYYYAIFSADKSGKYSKSIVKQAIATIKEIRPVDNNQNNKTYTNLGGVSSQIVEEVSRDEAEQIYEFNKYVSFNGTTRKLYTYIIGKSPNKLDEQDKFAIAYYIHNGTPTTIILGAGERTGVLNSYLSAFNKLPTNSDEWQDIIKIANGRWPKERNLKAESKAENTLFIQVYKRQPKMDNVKDNAAVTVITYGLRPAIRNMNSEKAAIKIFKAIFKDNPIDAVDWDIVRAIAYSGAIR